MFVLFKGDLEVGLYGSREGADYMIFSPNILYGYGGKSNCPGFGDSSWELCTKEP